MAPSTEKTAESFDSFLREKEEQISKMKFMHLEVPHNTQSMYSDSPLAGFSERLQEFKTKVPEHSSSRIEGFFYKKHKLFAGIICALIITACAISLSRS